MTMTTKKCQALTWDLIRTELLIKHMPYKYKCSATVRNEFKFGGEVRCGLKWSEILSRISRAELSANPFTT
jgi:hypothetical protein